MTLCFINFSRHSITFDRAHSTGLIILIKKRKTCCNNIFIVIYAILNRHCLFTVNKALQDSINTWQYCKADKCFIYKCLKYFTPILKTTPVNGVSDLPTITIICNACYIQSIWAGGDALFNCEYSSVVTVAVICNSVGGGVFFTCHHGAGGKRISVAV